MPCCDPLPGAVSLLTAAGLAACRSAPRGRPADLVVYGRVWTGDSARPWAGAVAVSGDTVAAVGDSAEIARLAGPATRVLANGAGDGDARLHGRPHPLHRRRVPARQRGPPAGRLARGVHRPAQGVRPRAAARRMDPGRRLGPRALARRAAPAPRVDRLGHAQQSGVREPARRAHGRWPTAPRCGRPGSPAPPRTSLAGSSCAIRGPGSRPAILKDGAMDPVRAGDPRAHRRPSATRPSRRALAYAASKGVTAFAHVSVDPADLGTYLRAQARRARSPRAPRSTFRCEAWRAVADTVAELGRGDDWVWIGGVKGYMDGSLGSTTALFYQPYDDDPTTSGVLVTPEDSLRAWIGAADSAGPAGRGARHRRAGQRRCCSTSTTASRGRTGRATGGSGSSTPSTFGRQDIDRLARMRRDRLDAAVPRDRRRALGGEADRARADQDHATPSARCSTGTRTSPSGPTGPSRRSTRSSASTPPSPGGRSTARTRTAGCPEEKITVEEALRAYTGGDAYGVFAERTRGRLAPGIQGRPGAAGPGPDADSAGGDRAGGRPGDGRGRPCRISIQMRRIATQGQEDSRMRVACPATTWPAIGQRSRALLECSPAAVGSSRRHLPGAARRAPPGRPRSGSRLTLPAPTAA